MTRHKIKPNKYTKIEVSIVGIGADIVSFLKTENYQKLNHLLNKLVLKKGEAVKECFPLALNFLFILGKLEYYTKDDVLQLVNKNETI